MIVPDLGKLYIIRVLYNILIHEFNVRVYIVSPD